MRQPGGPSAHVDGFAREKLPPRQLWPVMDYSKLPELAAYPDRLNAATALLDGAIAAGHGDRPCIRYGDLTWTYRELRERSRRVARALVEDLGLRTGQRVLLRAPNTPMLAACWLGVLQAGGVCVATMPLLRARELAVILERARVSHALCDAGLAEELRLAQDRAPELRTVALFTAAGDAVHPAADLDVLLRAKSPDLAPVDTAADDVALIAFTSGTTGQPKGAVHFHRDVLAMCVAFPRSVLSASHDDVCVGTPPLAFAFGLGGLLCFPMRFGACCVFPTERLTPETLLRTIATARCNTLYTSPTMYRALADAAASFDLRCLEKCVSAGETLPRATFGGFRRRTGVRIIDGLGSTEMLHIFVSASGDAIRPGSTGRAVPGYEVRVVDEDGRPLPAGEIGQLAVRGPTGCRYLDDVERQRQYVRDGWNYPGDVYRTDAEGYFWYQARADDMIISSGYNIAGPEVEAVLLEHPRVRECAVVGSPDAERGHVVRAVIVLRDPADAHDGTRRELQEFVKSQLAPYKYPRVVEFAVDLPRTETGKLQRFKLRS